MNRKERKISILFVIDGLEFGGGERVFLQLARGFRGDHDVCVATTPGGVFDREVRALGMHVFPVDMGQRFSLRPVCQISKILRDRKIDLVHSQGARADFFARVAVRKASSHMTVSYTHLTLPTN